MTASLMPAPTPCPQLRPLAPGEDEPLDEVFDGMSTRSRALRFLAPTPRLTGGLRRALAMVDRRHAVWVAEVGGRAVAFASYVQLAEDPATAEFAVAVVDRHQRAGIGRCLLAALTVAAYGRGVRTFSFTVQPDNRPALAFVRDAGATAWYDDGVVVGRLPVGQPAPAAPRRTTRSRSPHITNER